MKKLTRGLSVGLLWSTAVLLLANCASSPELDSYPRKAVDRPYTLPKHVATWHIPTYTGYFRNNSDETFLPPIPVPLVWEAAFSDDLNLVINPLPLTLRYQIARGPGGFTGAQFSLNGYIVSRDTITSSGTTTAIIKENEFRILPKLTFTHRIKLDEDLVLDLEPEVEYGFLLEGSGRDSWTVGLSVGPMVQLSDTFALQPKVSGYVTRATQDMAQALVKLTNNAPVETHFSARVGLYSTWSFARQWDFRPSYQYGGLGSKDGSQSHLMNLEFVHFW